jgi:nucleoside phosphorylase
LPNPLAHVGLLALPDELKRIQQHLERVPGSAIKAGARQYPLFRHPDYADLTIACGMSSGTGILNASCATHHLIEDVRPNLVVMTGIAGSMSSDAQLGDAVIANDVVHYLYQATDGRGKSFALQLDTNGRPIDPRIKGLVTKFVDEVAGDDPRWTDLRTPFTESDVLPQEILSQRRTPAAHPLILFGNVASGDIVCSSTNFKAILTDRSNRLLSAIDTESAGAAFVSSEAQLPWFFVRGISHYSDGPRSNLDVEYDPNEMEAAWRQHAADLAGRILVALLPHIAQSLQIGDPEGILARNTVLQAGEVKAISPLTEERRRIATYPSTVDSSPPTVFQNIQEFCSRIFKDAAAQIVIVRDDGNLRLRKLSTEAVAIESLPRDLRSGQLQGELSAEKIVWQPNVDQRTNEGLQGVVNEAALWLGRVPQDLATDEPPSVAVMDDDGNVTVAHNLYLRRLSRTLRTDKWSENVALGLLRIELRRILGTTQRDIPTYIKAVRTSLRATNRLLVASDEGADSPSE